MSGQGVPVPGTTRVGRKVKPTPKVVAIMGGVFRKAYETAVTEADDTITLLTGLLKENPDLQALDPVVQIWEDARDQVHEMFAQLEHYVEDEEYATLKEQLRNNVMTYQEMDERVKGYRTPLLPQEDEKKIEESIKTEETIREAADAVKQLEEKLEASVRELNLAKSRLREQEGVETVKPAVEIPEVTTRQYSSIKDEGIQILKAVMQSLEERSNRRDLPRIEPGIYKGDPLEFNPWWNSFETAIESKAECDRDRLVYLYQYTEGKVKAMVSNYMGLRDGTKAWKNAKAQLFQRYGSPFNIAEAYKARLESWTKIAEDDGEALTDYADFLCQCQVAMESLSYLEHLDTQNENVKMAAKLPDSVRKRWNRIADKAVFQDSDDLFLDFSAMKSSYPTFRQFCKFVAGEARVANGPCSNSKMKSQASHSQRVMQTSVRPTAAASAPPPPPTGESRRPRCSFCQGDHLLYQCQRFLSNTGDFKREYAKKRGLCFGCLRRGHREFECSIKNTSLMRDGDSADSAHQQATCHATTQARHQAAVEEAVIYTRILPVWIYSSDNSNHRILTYAALDTQSDCTFITQSLADKLQVKQTRTTLELTTMGSKTWEKCTRVTRLKMRGQWEDDEVSVAKCYTKDIPISMDALPDEQELSRWSHLSDLVNQIPPKRADGKVEILIGADCARAFTPVETRVSRATDMFAEKTVLGWSIMGSPDRVSSDTIMQRCFRSAAKEVTYDKVMEAFGLDFAENKGDDEKLSAEDAMFLKIMSEGMTQREDGHFEAPLPMKEDVKPTDLPDSRPNALHCLNSVGKKMRRDADYAAQYKGNMDKIIDRSKAELVDDDDDTPICETWYWSHHGVNHPVKKTLRTVFNGSTRIRGVCINDFLLCGPDLTNSLVGVLLRFRTFPIFVICDVEGMFHQVYVRVDFRNYIRFFWYENGDPNGRVLTYRMTVHLFGATSSPGCANYALKETARRFGDRFGKKAASFIEDHFYVDDGLGGAEDSKEASDLVRDSHQLSRCGGFNLCKYATNDPEVEKAIPEELRAPKKESIDLGQDGSEGGDRTLGVGIDLVKDVFRYYIQLKNYEPTRRSLLSRLASVYDPMGLISAVLLQGRNLLQRLCAKKFTWDQVLPSEVVTEWDAWYRSLEQLKSLEIPRCISDVGRHDLKRTLVCTFGDASNDGHGTCCYRVQIDKSGGMHPRLVYTKSRVNPVKRPTMPRLELQASVLSVKVGVFVCAELGVDIEDAFYFSDSSAALGYIFNVTKKFRLYVTN